MRGDLLLISREAERDRCTLAIAFKKQKGWGYPLYFLPRGKGGRPQGGGELTASALRFAVRISRWVLLVLVNRTPIALQSCVRFRLLTRVRTPVNSTLRADCSLSLRCLA